MPHPTLSSPSRLRAASMSRVERQLINGREGDTDRVKQCRARGEQLGRADQPSRRGGGRGESRKAFPDPLLVAEFLLQRQAFHVTALGPVRCPAGID